jgi:hypothetical protein
VLGTISSKEIVGALRRIEEENLLAHHLLNPDFIKVDRGAELGSLVGQFLQKRVHIACFLKRGEFGGYLERRALLKLLANSKERIEKYLEKDFIEIDAKESIKKILKSLDRDLPIVVLKEGRPLVAYSPEELYFLTFVNEYLKKRIERDFETIRAEGRRFLRYRLDQQLLNYMKERGFHLVHFFRIGDIADKALSLPKKSSVGRAAQMMLELNKGALAVTEGGVVTDLSLLVGLR